MPRGVTDAALCSDAPSPHTPSREAARHCSQAPATPEAAPAGTLSGVRPQPPHPVSRLGMDLVESARACVTAVPTSTCDREIRGGAGAGLGGGTGSEQRGPRPCGPPPYTVHM